MQVEMFESGAILMYIAGVSYTDTEKARQRESEREVHTHTQQQTHREHLRYTYTHSHTHTEQEEEREEEREKSTHTHKCKHSHTVHMHYLGTYSSLHLECYLIAISNWNLLGLFATERGKRELENWIIDWDLRV